MANVLVIDDSSFQVTVARLIMEEAGFQVLAAAEGAAGLAIARSEPVDVILLDWLMPEMSGAQVLQAMLDEGISIPVIVVTGDPDEAREECARLGAAEVLNKPPESEVLVNAVRAAIAAGTG